MRRASSMSLAIGFWRFTFHPCPSSSIAPSGWRGMGRSASTESIRSRSPPGRRPKRRPVRRTARSGAAPPVVTRVDQRHDLGFGVVQVPSNVEIEDPPQPDDGHSYRPALEAWPRHAVPHRDDLARPVGQAPVVTPGAREIRSGAMRPGRFSRNDRKGIADARSSAQGPTRPNEPPVFCAAPGLHRQEPADIEAQCSCSSPSLVRYCTHGHTPVQDLQTARDQLANRESKLPMQVNRVASSCRFSDVRFTVFISGIARGVSP